MKRFVGAVKKAIQTVKEWKTTKKSLYLAVFMVVIYGCVATMLKINGIEPDATLTSEWFNFFKWFVVTGASVATVQIVKKKNDD